MLIIEIFVFNFFLFPLLFYGTIMSERQQVVIRKSCLSSEVENGNIVSQNEENTESFGDHLSLDQKTSQLSYTTKSKSVSHWYIYQANT